MRLLLIMAGLVLVGTPGWGSQFRDQLRQAATDNTPLPVELEECRTAVIFEVHDIIGFPGSRYRFTLFEDARWRYVEGNLMGTAVGRLAPSELNAFLEFLIANRLFDLESKQGVLKDESIVHMKANFAGRETDLMLPPGHEITKRLEQRISHIVQASRASRKQERK